MIDVPYRLKATSGNPDARNDFLAKHKTTLSKFDCKKPLCNNFLLPGAREEERTA
jgi:hypothetical protein